MNETPQQFPELLIRAVACVLILSVVLGGVIRRVSAKWMSRPGARHDGHCAADGQDRAERLTYLL